MSQLRVVGIIRTEGAYRVASLVFFYRTVVEFTFLLTLDAVASESFDVEWGS